MYSVAFRYQENEYYAEYATDVSFGGTKADHVKISSAVRTVLRVRNNGSKVQLSAGNPLPEQCMEIPFHSVEKLSGHGDASVYVSRITGKSSASVDLPYNGRIRVGRNEDNEIVLSFPIVSRFHFQIQCVNGVFHVEDVGSTYGIYLNGRKISKAVMKSGDVLSVYTLRFHLKEGVLYFENMGDAIWISESLKQIQKPEKKEQVIPGKEEAALFLHYHLSPRIREQLPTEGLILSAAPGAASAPGGRRGNMAYLISSGAMMAASLATGMLSPALLFARAVGFISPIANMAMFSKMNKEEKQQFEEYERIRQERYQAYIKEQKARIKKIADVQRRIVTSENPSPGDCLMTVKSLKRKLWERLPEDSDFLVTRLGIGQVPLCVEVKTRADVDGFQLIEEDELEQLSAKIIEETRMVDRMPVCVDLRRFQTVGLVGKPEYTQYLLRSMLVEITTQHNYQDVHIAGLFDRNFTGNWRALRWLPHIWDESGQVRYLAFDEKRRHVVCEILAEIVRQRKADLEDGQRRQQMAVHPHYIVLVQERTFIEEELYKELKDNSELLGFTVLILADTMYGLPQKTQVIIECQSEKRGCTYETGRYEERAFFETDSYVHGSEIDSFCRRQAAIELDTLEGKAAIPAAVTFLQGYQASTVEDLKIWSRWNHNKPFLSLAAPIGVMEGGKIFSLDIRSGEQSHGPHGLLAGTTGSGKSELLQSWILSMAVNYHPHDVNFVIIDYKGGGMSDVVEPLPHVVGKITNIDRNISRSLVSLKSELRRRQELFAQYGVNNIDKYQRAYEDGIAKERLPHLIIVTDEFAELKKEEPQFLTELNSVATIGRSLGIHMLLATQKPAGVVTPQIDSNSRFRICMKVQDVADSREMIKRADAAKITQAGRAYIRVGEDESFELFQSFYSAAEYTGDSGYAAVHDNQVRLVSVTGNRISSLKKKKRNKSTDTADEMTAVINGINQLCREKGIKKLPGPWLPELPKWLSFEELYLLPAFDGRKWTEETAGLSVPVGKYDIPAQQKQGILYLDFMETGHFGVFGLPGTGKTTLLKTVVTNLGRFYTPKRVEITIIDAASWSMSECSAMPHVKEVILNQEEEKLARFVSRMQKELQMRKNAFLKHAVTSLESYWETVSDDLPAMVLVVDQIVPLFGQAIELSELLTEIAATGSSYGIYLLFSANSTLGFNYKFLQLIRGMITFQLSETGEYSSLVGSIAGISLPTVPGRALFRGNPAVSFQTAMYVDEKDEQERNKALKKLFRSMREACTESREPLMHTESQKESAEEPKGQPLKARGTVVIGKDTQDLDTVVVDLTENYVLAVGAEDQDQREKMIRKLVQQLSDNPEHQIEYLSATDGCGLRKKLEEVLNNRQANRKQHKGDADFDNEKWLKGFAQIVLVIERLEEVSAHMSDSDRRFYRRVLTKADGLGISIIAGISRDCFSASDADMLTDALRTAGHMLALDGKPSEYISGYYLEDPDADLVLEKGEAAWICQKKLKIVRIE